MDWKKAAEDDVSGDNHLTMGSAMEEEGEMEEEEEEKTDDGNGQIGQIEWPWTF
jgi:hypothetical protein